MSVPITIAEDMHRLEHLLRGEVAPHLKPRAEARILDLACGRCDEAETLVKVVQNEAQAEAVKLVGADIRIREVREARERYYGKLDAEFLIEDATKLDAHKELKDFDLVFLRHQNYWHGPDVWKRIFDTGAAKLTPDGLLVITSYFDREHKLAIEALQKQGLKLISSKRNKASRALADAPGKSVDRWIAVFKRPS